MALNLFQYIVIGLITAAVLIPIVRWFWKRFDLPSKRAIAYFLRKEEEEHEQQMWASIEAKVEAEKHIQRDFEMKQKAKQEASGKILDDDESESAWASLGVDVPIQPVEREEAPPVILEEESSESEELVEEPDWELVERLEKLSEPVEGVPEAPDLDELEGNQSSEISEEESKSEERDETESSWWEDSWASN
jgi:hypothetical protein